MLTAVRVDRVRDEAVHRGRGIAIEAIREDGVDDGAFEEPVQWTGRADWLRPVGRLTLPGRRSAQLRRCARRGRCGGFGERDWARSCRRAGRRANGGVRDLVDRRRGRLHRGGGPGTAVERPVRRPVGRPPAGGSARRCSRTGSRTRGASCSASIGSSAVALRLPRVAVAVRGGADAAACASASALCVQRRAGGPGSRAPGPRSVSAAAPRRTLGELAAPVGRRRA